LALDHFAESVQKEEAIPVVQEDRLASVVFGGDVIERFGKLDAEGLCYVQDSTAPAGQGGTGRRSGMRMRYFKI
jgi:hypothetical protein